MHMFYVIVLILLPTHPSLHYKSCPWKCTGAKLHCGILARSCDQWWVHKKMSSVKGAIIKSQFSPLCSSKTVASLFVTTVFLHCVGSSQSAESFGAQETTYTSTSSPPSSWEQVPSSLKTLCYLQTRVWTIALCQPWVRQLVNDVAVMLRVVELTKKQTGGKQQSR